MKNNRKLDLISGINLMFDNHHKISSDKIFNIINEIKKQYDFILIDTSSECFLIIQKIL
ncbi:MAG: hypothetical protein ACLS95_01425 [Clostridia bacterium]